MSASTGKPASSDWAKLWNVCTANPPRASTTLANRRRARARSSASGTSPSASRSASRPASSHRTHRVSRSKIRPCISAAAALVKVRHSNRSGAAPVSSRRRTRAVSTCVLPVPADADTQALSQGLAAIACSGRNGRSGFAVIRRAPAIPPPGRDGHDRCSAWNNPDGAWR